MKMKMKRKKRKKLCTGGKFNKHVNHLYAEWCPALKIGEKWSSRKILYISLFLGIHNSSNVLAIEYHFVYIGRTFWNWKSLRRHGKFFFILEKFFKTAFLKKGEKSFFHSFASEPKSIYQMFIYDLCVHIQMKRKTKNERNERNLV